MTPPPEPKTPLVAVAGLPGTGTTTLCRILSKRLELPHAYAGQFFRDMAKEKAMDLVQFGEYAEKHREVDEELDRRMIEVAKARGAVLEGRMSAWQVDQGGAGGLKVLLEAPEDVRVARVAAREGIEDVEKVRVENRHREASEAKRYREFYGFDPNDPRHYDLVIDSSDKAPDAIADLVMARLFP